MPLKLHGGSGGVGGIPHKAAPGSDGVGGIPSTERWSHPCCVTGDLGSAGGIPFSGNPDGAGGIPHSGDPNSAGSIPASVHFAPTAGLILDSTNAPIAGALVLVLACDGTPIAATTTDEFGAFALTLPKVAGLTLVLPTLGVDDVPIVAGHPLLIIVP